MKIINKDLKHKIARKFYHLAMRLDNSGNCDFDRNGEQKFIQELFGGNYSPPTAKFIINEIIFYIAIVANKIFRLMDGEHNAHTKP